MKLLKRIYVKWSVPARGLDAPWMQASKTMDEVMDDEHGPCAVGVYELVDTRAAEKVVTFKTKRTRK